MRGTKPAHDDEEVSEVYAYAAKIARPDSRDKHGHDDPRAWRE
jgi:hypothetical protein